MLPDRSFSSLTGVAGIQPLSWFFVIGISVLIGPFAAAQDDIFGFGTDDTIADGDFLSSNATPARANVNALPASSNSTVLEIRRSPPTNPESYARTFLYLYRVKEFAELKRYLAQFQQISMTPEIGEAMRREIGTSELIKLKRIPGLSADESATIESIFDAIGSFQTGQQRLADAYEQLFSDNRNTQKQGIITLQSAASSGMAYVVNQILLDPRNPSPAVSYFVSLGGTNASRSVAVAYAVADSRQRARLAIATARIRTDDYVFLLSHFVLTQNKTGGSSELIETALTSAANSISRHGALPDREGFRLGLSRQLAQRLENYRTARQSEFPLTVEVWSSKDKTRVESALGTEIDQRLSECQQIASSIVSLSTSNDELRALAIATLLECEYAASQTAIVSQPMQVVDEIQPDVEMSSQLASMLWSLAVREKLYGAQLRIAQYLGQLSTRETDQQIQKPLQEALVSPILAVRLLAALPAVSSIAEDNEFYQRLISARAEEMAQLSAGPMALVIGNDDFLRNSLQANFDRGGIDSLDAKTGREAMSILRKRPTIDFVVFVDRVGDVSLFQLAQRIRNFRFTSAAPVAFLADELSSSEFSMIDEHRNVTIGSNPPDLSATIEVVQRIEGSSLTPRLTASDRVALREIAIEFRETKNGPADGSSKR